MLELWDACDDDDDDDDDDHDDDDDGDGEDDAQSSPEAIARSLPFPLGPMI